VTIRILKTAFAAVVICALVPRNPIAAQVSTTVSPSTAWMTSTNYLGITNFRCDCTVGPAADNGARRFIFRSEPMVLGVVRGSPSYGILSRGDVITHINGYSILTSEGARRFSSIEPGDDVDLTFKRDGRTMKASLHASEPRANTYVIAPEASGYSIGYDYTPTPAMPATPSVPVAPAPGAWGAVVTPRPPEPAYPTIPAAPMIIATPGTTVWATTPAIPAVPAIPAPLGWFGFSIRCNDCGWSTSRSDDSPVWESDEAPELSMVAAESPAGRAGLRAGDRITHIDGLSLMSREGARRFGRVRPGQKVRLTVRRGDTSITRELTLATRPELRAARAAIAATVPRPPRAMIAPSMRRELRYTGQLDNVSVEVWSAGGPSVEKIGDTMVITTGSSVVRIKVDPKKAKD
jgi:membrane-associated protease RseP (regulator of RpoE activity)